MPNPTPNVTVTRQGPNFELAVKEGDERLAHLYVMTLKQRIGRAVLLTGGIGGVHTAPAQREKGLSRHLLTYAVQFMTENGYDWSGLFGIPNFYTRFGYASALPEGKLNIATRRAELAVARHRLRPMLESDLDTILSIYNQVNQDATGTIVREPGVWKGFSKASGWGTIPSVVVAVDGEAQDPSSILGYAVYNRFGNYITVAEVAALDETVYESLIAYFAKEAVAKRVESITFFAPREHPLTQTARRLGCSWQVHFYPDAEGMWRLLNLRSTFEKLLPEFEARLRRAGLLARRIRARSESSPTVPSGSRPRHKAPPHGIVIDTGECGCVGLTVTGGRLRFVEVTEDTRATDVSGFPRIAIDQQVIAQLLLGYRHIDEVIRTLGLRGRPGCEWLQALFPDVEGVVWWPDRF